MGHEYLLEDFWGCAQGSQSLEDLGRRRIENSEQVAWL